MMRGWPMMGARLRPGFRRASGERGGGHAAHLSGTMCGARAVNTATPVVRTHQLGDDDGCGESGDRDAGRRGEPAARPHVETEPPEAVGRRGRLIGRLVAGGRVEWMVDGRRVLAPEGVCARGEAEARGDEVHLVELRFGRRRGAEGDEVLGRPEPVAGQAHDLGLLGPLLPVLGLRTFPQPRCRPFPAISLYLVLSRRYYTTGLVSVVLN